MAYFWNDTLALYKREMLIFRSHFKTNIVRSLILPLTLILILGNIGNMTGAKTNIAIVNYAQNPQAIQFISELEASHSLTIVSQTNEYQALKMLQNGNVTGVVVILPAFPQGNPGVYVYYSNNFINLGSSLQTIESTAQSFGAESRLSAQAESQAQLQSSVFLNPTYATNASYKTFLIAGIIIMVAVFGSLFGGGMSIITDKQLGNLKSFLVTPIDRKSIVTSKIFYSMTLALINGTIAIIIGLLDGAGIAMGAIGLVWIYMLIILVTIIFSSVTLVIASRIDKPEVYAIFANTLILPLWLISGAFTPTSALPSWLQPISVIDPLTYATNGIRYVTMNGYYPLNLQILDFGILGIFSIIMLIIALNSLKRTIA